MPTHLSLTHSTGAGTLELQQQIEALQKELALGKISIEVWKAQTIKSAVATSVAKLALSG